MRILGAMVILLAGAFFSAACYGAYQAPKWSSKPRPVNVSMNRDD